jgi:RNA-directed DNA polymerase
MVIEFHEYAQAFRILALAQGRSEEFVGRALTYAERLHDANLPIVYDRRHLAALLGFDSDALWRQGSLDGLYRSFKILKHNGGYRRIDEPVEVLKAAQRWILRSILSRFRFDPCVTGFVGGRSILDNARRHIGRRMVLSLDIRDFFGSVSVDAVRREYRSLGFSHDAADALASICVYREQLPQGAPTSPALSNLVFRHADTLLVGFAKELRITYSRYADDLTFSGSFNPSVVVGVCRQVLGKYGFDLNDAKTRLMRRHQRQEVTGIVVNDKLQAPREKRRTLRQEIYFVKKHGIEGHESHRPFFFDHRHEHLRGLAEFVRTVNIHDRDAADALATLGRVVYVSRRLPGS